MKTLWTALAILAALLLQSALSRVLPSHARTLDPFLLVLVYCGLSGGEIHGMLAGAAAGWVEDIHFAGPVVGLSGLTKILVGFSVGAAAARFMLTGPGPRLIVLFSATLADGVLFERLASLFDVPAVELDLSALASRAAANALVGTALYEALERRTRREAFR